MQVQDVRLPARLLQELERSAAEEEVGLLLVVAAAVDPRALRGQRFTRAAGDAGDKRGAPGREELPPGCPLPPLPTLKMLLLAQSGRRSSTGTPAMRARYTWVFRGPCSQQQAAAHREQ